MKKKLLAEMAGTMVLVLMGCGAAVFNGGCGTTQQVLTVAMAFGLSVVAMAYAIGGVSGCHINPAITLGVWLSGRMPGREAAGYMAAQVAGAFVGSLLLYGIVGCVDEAVFVTNGAAMATHTGSNAVAAGVPLLGGLLAEVVFSMVFVLVVLGTTSAKHGAGALAGLAIGLSLVWCISFASRSRALPSTPPAPWPRPCSTWPMAAGSPCSSCGSSSWAPLPARPWQPACGAA